MDTELGALSTRELGGLLIKNRVLVDTAEAKWLAMLAGLSTMQTFRVEPSIAGAS